MERVLPILVPELDVEIPADGVAIGEASRLTGVGIEALRYYEREGLMLDPARRNSGGRRRYDAHDLAWIAGLVMLRETGMSIGGIRVMAELSRTDGTEPERLAVLEQHRSEVLDQMERTKAHLRAIEKKIAAYREIAAQEGTLHEPHEPPLATPGSPG